MNSHKDSLIDPGKEDTKPLWYSKAFWAAIVTATLPHIPVVGPIIATMPGAYDALAALILIGIRTVTDTPVSLRK